MRIRIYMYNKGIIVVYIIIMHFGQKWKIKIYKKNNKKTTTRPVSES